MLKSNQIKYAMDRINAIYSQKLNDIRTQCEVPAKELSLNQLVAGIKSGTIKLNPRRDFSESNVMDMSSYNSGPQNLFDLKLYESKFDQKQFNIRSKKLQDKVAEIQDTLMLGDSQAALSAIEGLAKASF